MAHTWIRSQHSVQFLNQLRLGFRRYAVDRQVGAELSCRTRHCCAVRWNALAAEIFHAERGQQTRHDAAAADQHGVLDQRQDMQICGWALRPAELAALPAVKQKECQVMCWPAYSPNYAMARFYSLWHRLFGKEFLQKRFCSFEISSALRSNLLLLDRLRSCR